MLERGLTVSALARKLGYSRNSVSLAINRSMFAGVLASIRKELGL